jgi:thiamine-monophosphate kinase
MPTESDFLDWVRQQQRGSALVQLPAGDDLAVMRWPAGDLLLVGVDQVLDRVHFDSAVHSPEAIGKKAMNRNLSDCAAMGCLPAAALVGVALPRGVGIDYAKRLYDGLRQAGEAFDCPIVGGDTGSWEGALTLSVTILGRSGGLAPITRGGARAGDAIYVTGPLGGSIRGRHMDFVPRIREGRLLAQSGLVTAMIDLSDGLSRDLPRLTSGATLNSADIPLHADAHFQRPDAQNALEHALHDGEDYELLFTASAQPPLGIRIGAVVDEPGIELIENTGRRISLPPQAWDHKL